MNKRTWYARLAPLTLATQLLMASSYAQPLPPARVTVPQNTAAPAAAAHVHAPGQLESSHEEIQKTRSASAANRSSRLFMPPNAAQCSNGDFESNTFAGWSGKDGSVVAGPIFTWSNTGISSGAINASTAHQTLVSSPANDPYAPISVTASGMSTKAVRIGNGVKFAGAEALTKTFTVTQATMNFKYALVLEDPGHPASDQPGFEIRVFNASGVDITKKTSGMLTRPPRAFVTATDSRVVANASNPFFQVSPIPGPNGSAAYPAKVVYKDWTCSSIDLGDLMGQTVTVEFITNDCTQTGHAGWAYIDDICGLCDKAPDGTVTLNQAASTDCGPGKLCFDFTIPKSPGAAPGTTELSLQLYQNGVAVGAPLTSPVLGTDGQHCFPMLPVVTPALNGSLAGFDWVVTSTNKIGSTTLTPKFVGTVPNGVMNGFNNDYAFVCKGGDTCCPPMDNATIKGLFGHAGNTANTYTEQFGGGLQGPTSVTAFINNYNAYLTILKWSCPSVAKLSIVFNLYSTTGIGGPLGGTPLATNTLTFSGGTPTGTTSFFNYALNNNAFYGIQAVTTALDANNNPVQCGFASKCLEDDRFTWNHQVGAKLASPGAAFGK